MPCASTSEMSRFMLRSLVQLHVEPSMKQPTESALFFAMMMLFEAATMNWLSAVLLTSASELSPNTKVPSPKALERRPTAKLYWPLATWKRPTATGNSRTSAGSRVIGMSANDVWARSHRFVPHHAQGARVDFQRLVVERAEFRDRPECIAALYEEIARTARCLEISQQITVQIGR